MSTGRSWADPSGRADRATRRSAEIGRAVADLRPLLRFRTSGLRGAGRRAAGLALALLVLLTVAASWLPAYLPASLRRMEVMSLLPSAMLGVVVVAGISAAASGGGRELVPRDEAVAFPVSPTTDHLGALLLAPLNIAWLLQAWTLLGATAYVAGPRPGLVLSQLLVLAWLAAATALAQVAGWALEWVRRGPHGVPRIRVLTTLGVLAGSVLVVSGRLLPLLQASPTTEVTVASLQAAGGVTVRYGLVLAGVLLLGLTTVAAGAALAHAVARRPARDEHRLETSAYAARPAPASDLAALVRLDRAGVWRSVSLRRGLLVLAVLPGLVAIGGGLAWDMLAVLPGLVASGGALLFGVNAWCLDGGGALWRDSLPVRPRVAFAARALVLVEVVLVASAGTIALASLRAGAPSVAELSAVAAAAVVVAVQVVSASLRWSVRRPFPVDLRSARATPAPPLVMVGYSARLALSTTLVGLVFAGLGRLSWEWPVLVATPMLLLSLWRLARTGRRWADPGVRSRVVTAVAA